MVPSQKFYESSSPTIFVCWFFCWSIAVLWGVSQTILMSLKEDASQFDNFFFCRVKSWVRNQPTQIKVVTIPGWMECRKRFLKRRCDGGKKDLELVLGRFAQPFFVVQRLKKQKEHSRLWSDMGYVSRWLIDSSKWMIGIHKILPNLRSQCGRRRVQGCSGLHHLFSLLQPSSSVSCSWEIVVFDWCPCVIAFSE